MKNSYLKKLLILIALFLPVTLTVHAQTDDLLNVLIKKNVITQQEADSIRADAAIKEQAKKDKDKKNQHGITIGSRALQISGLIQTEYEGFAQKTVNNTFLLHRARLDVKGDIDDAWSYEVYTEFSGVNPKLLDAYTTYKIADYLKFTAGQFKVPFSLESLFSDSQLEFIDRSQVVNALAGRSSDVIGNQNGRDIGFQASGSFAKINNVYLFDYAVGVFNGAGYDVTTDNNNHKDLGGRLGIHPLANLSFGVDYYNGRGNYILAPATKAADHKREREGVDARYVIGGLSLQAEYDKGTDETTKRQGWYGQVAYFVIPQKLQLAAKYDTYDPSKAAINDISNYYIGGVNYFFNNWAKFTIDYVDRREPANTPQVKNDILEAQLQLTF
jgi:phosphate-selective porin OprO/OprP